MALLDTPFNPSTVESMVAPAGKYTAKITESVVKMNSKGTGEYIKNTWEILEGPDSSQNGRKVFQYLNIVNENEMAEKIGKSELKQICEALGITSLKDTNELIGVPLLVQVKVRPPKGDYDESNAIGKVEKLPTQSSSETTASPFE